MSKDVHSYEFTFTRSRFLLFAAGLTIMGILAFAGGVVVGMQFGAPIVVQDTIAKEKVKLARSTAPPPAAAEPPKAIEEVSAPPPKPTPAETKAEPAPSTPSANSKPRSSGIYLAIQVGSFRESANAEELAGRLKSSGYQPEVSSRPDVNGREWYIVRVGPYHDWTEATEAAEEISKRQGTQAFIRTVPAS